MVPTFTVIRSSGEAASFAPAASPRLRRSPSPWPPDRQDQSDPGVPARMGRCAPRSSPDPPDFELAEVLRGFTPLVPRVHLPVSLAGPTPSGSTGASRRCRGCSPPDPADSPGLAAPCFCRPAATGRRCGSHTRTRITAPRGARSPTSTRINSASRRRRNQRQDHFHRAASA
jgi:hypothetical protein